MRKNCTHKPGWWFGTSDIFPSTGNNYSSQLTFIFFRGVESSTTNQWICPAKLHTSFVQGCQRSRAATRRYTLRPAMEALQRLGRLGRWESRDWSRKWQEGGLNMFENHPLFQVFLVFKKRDERFWADLGVAIVPDCSYKGCGRQGCKQCLGSGSWTLRMRTEAPFTKLTWIGHTAHPLFGVDVYKDVVGNFRSLFF